MSDDPGLVYDHVRRLILSIEESITESIKWAAFEKNDEPTWWRVRHEVPEYLASRWRDGALVGTNPTDVFFLRCDRTTMTQDDIDKGRLICLVGVAQIKPVQFVIVKIGLFTTKAKP